MPAEVPTPQYGSPLIVLIGPPGSGKTTIGRLLAEQLDVDFRDVDTDIEAMAGKSISEIFIDDGESAFRAMEATAVAQALAEHAGVLSLGGGAILDPQTRARLIHHRVAYLQVSFADAVKRVGLGIDRPVLALNPRATLRHLLESRHPLYVEVATVTVETSGRSPAQIVAELAEVVEESVS